MVMAVIKNADDVSESRAIDRAMNARDFAFGLMTRGALRMKTHADRRWAVTHRGNGSLPLWFKKTVRFNLPDIRCRPAKVTLRTAPRFFTGVQIPAKAVLNP